MTRHWVIGDVHGCYSALERLLGLLPESDHLVFCGDVVGRGTDVVGTAERVWTLVCGGRATWLQGNHEQRLSQDPALQRALWPSNPEVALQWVERLQALPLVFHGTGWVATHAGFDSNDCPDLEIREPFWQSYDGRFGRVVVAHTPGLDVRRHGQIVLIDTGASTADDRLRSALKPMRWCRCKERPQRPGLRARYDKELHQAQPTLVNTSPLTLYRSNRRKCWRMCWPQPLPASPWCAGRGPGGGEHLAHKPMAGRATGSCQSFWHHRQSALSFLTSLLRHTVDGLLEQQSSGGGADPWRAQNLVWPLLELLPELLDHPSSAPLQHWLNTRKSAALEVLDPPLWQLARAIADAIDDYSLYRPAMLEAWLKGQATDARGTPLSPTMLWQPQLMQQLHSRLGCLPFGMRARQLIRRLQEGWRPELPPQPPLRLFGLSSLAPVQVELLQALSCLRSIELYLLTPCPDLWQRQSSIESQAPLDEEWLLTVPSVEARFGRLGAEFQQLLEGSGETQLGSWRALDPFFFPATTASSQGQKPTLLEQLQEHLVHGTPTDLLTRTEDDQSLQFHACPGRLRQLQVLRDQILQLLANDHSLEPRDILVMTPQVEAFAPLVGAVFGDNDATGVRLPWRLTDRSQQSEAGISQGVLQLLALGGERLTASALETVLANAPLLRAHQLEPDEAEDITQSLQQAGFRWGLDSRDRGGDPTHSLAWAIDRLVLGVVYPETPGLALGNTAPMALPGSLEQQGRWLGLLRQLQRSLQWLSHSRSVQAWVEGLRPQLMALFADGGDWAWELQTIHSVLTNWGEVAGNSSLELSAPVVGEVLAERLSEGSGRFGHRSGASPSVPWNRCGRFPTRCWC